MTAPAPRRFRRGDWLALGLAALAEQGPAGLTIEALCRRADKTKGSFYAHFPAIETYLSALALDTRIEQGMRRLAQLDASVAAICAEVDRERIAYLERLHGESGRFSQREALALARIEYAAFLGFQQLDLGLSPQDLHDDYGRFMRLLARPDSA